MKAAFLLLIALFISLVTHGLLFSKYELNIY